MPKYDWKWVRVCPNCNEITSLNTDKDKVKKGAKDLHCGLCHVSSPASNKQFRPYGNWAQYPQNA